MINRPQIRSQNSHRDFIRSQSVVKRRKKRRKIQMIVVIVLFVLALFGLSELTKIQSFQISKVVVVGNSNVSSDEIQNVANTYLNTTYLGLFPKTNAFIYPKEKIKQAILSTYPRIADVDLYTESLNILNIKIKERDPAAVWCAAIKCYLVASDSYIYAEVQDVSSDSSLESSTSTSFVSVTAISKLPRMSGSDDVVGPEPIGKYVYTPELFKNLLYSVQEINNMKMRVKDVQVFSRDEIIFNIVQNGKIILADRKPFTQSIDDLKSAFSSPALTSSSSFEYVDTRFGNKVFYKLEKAVGSSSVSKL